MAKGTVAEDVDQSTPLPELEPQDDSKNTSTDGHPSFDDIAREAYAIYMANGARDGRDMDDWLEAETRLRASRA
jgi:hypothetical protein